MTTKRDIEVWNSFGADRIWVCRIIAVTSSINVLSKLIGMAALDNVKFDVYLSVASLVFSVAGLMLPKARDSIAIITTFAVIWALTHVVNCIAALVFVWSDGKSFLYPLGLHKGEDTNLTGAALRFEPIPFLMVLTLAALGLPIKITMPIAVVVFVFDIVVAVSFLDRVEHDLDPTDYITFVVNKLYNSLLTIYFAWATQQHHHKAQDGLVLLKHTLRQWINQKDTDRATRNRIVGYIFHEVRNPLNNITLAADLLSDFFQQHHQALLSLCEQNNDDVDVLELLSTIATAADSACHVLNDALSLQKLETGTFEFVKQPFSLAKFHTQAVRVAGPMMQQKRIMLHSEFDPTLENITVSGDFNRLQQVLNNFFSNAYKFTPSSGTVTIRTVKLAEVSLGENRFITVRSSVQDSGAGIAPGDHERVFQAWSQIRASDLQKGQGSGLGLSLCKAFVETGHNGRIGVESDIGAGSTFFFEIDYQVCDEPPHPGTHAIAPQVNAANLRNSSPIPYRRGQPPPPASEAADTASTSSGHEVRHNTNSGAFSTASNSHPNSVNLGRPRDRATPPSAARSLTMTSTPKQRNQALAMVIYPDVDDSTTVASKNRSSAGENDVDSDADPMVEKTQPAGNAPLVHQGSQSHKDERRALMKQGSSDRSRHSLEMVQTNSFGNKHAHNPRVSSSLANLNMQLSNEDDNDTANNDTVDNTAKNTNTANANTNDVATNSRNNKNSKASSLETEPEAPYIREDSMDFEATKDVLIVDDSLVTRKLVSKILGVLQVSFEVCENGKEAVEKIVTRRSLYKLVIMDKEMPVMDGFDATRTLRAANYTLPIVGLTGNAMDQQVSDFLAAGANDVFCKPIKRDVLVRVLNQYNIRTQAGPGEDSTTPLNLAPNDLHPRHAKHSFGMNPQHQRSAANIHEEQALVNPNQGSEAQPGNDADPNSTNNVGGAHTHAETDATKHNQATSSQNAGATSNPANHAESNPATTASSNHQQESDNLNQTAPNMNQTSDPNGTTTPNESESSTAKNSPVDTHSDGQQHIGDAGLDCNVNKVENSLGDVANDNQDTLSPPNQSVSSSSTTAPQTQSEAATATTVDNKRGNEPHHAYNDSTASYSTVAESYNSSQTFFKPMAVARSGETDDLVSPSTTIRESGKDGFDGEELTPANSALLSPKQPLLHEQ